MIRKWVAGVLVVALPVVTAAYSGARLKDIGSRAPSSAEVLYLPSGKYLKMISLGFSDVLADLIYIWSIQYYSNYDGDDRSQYLEHIYKNVISELDPHYIDPYLLGALIMALEQGDPEMALRLLDKGIAANPDEWILPFEAGFTCYDNLKDYARAARYFEKAMNDPNAPIPITRLRAEMYNKMGDKRSSLRYWTQIHDTADNDYVRDISERHMHDLAIEVDLESLHKAVDAYKARHGIDPTGLEMLVREGLIERVPLDPDGKSYLYNPATGEIRCQSRYRLYRREKH
ncbi:MAG: hypothetical protein ACE5HU_05865 [Acidobacteriota bacterium]